MNTKEIVYQAISEIAHTDDPFRFAVHDDISYDIAARAVEITKEQYVELLKTLYDECTHLKNNLDRVTTGNLVHKIGNIKFSLNEMQVFMKQKMVDEK